MKRKRASFAALMVVLVLLGGAGEALAVTPAELIACDAVAFQPEVVRVGNLHYVEGFGGGGCESGNVTVSVCLDYNGVTRVETCRPYQGSGSAGGPTGRALCTHGLWATMVTVIGPAGTAPDAEHSSFLIATPFNCPINASSESGEEPSSEEGP